LEDLLTAWIAGMQPVTYSWLVVVVAVACAAIGWLGIAGWIAVAVVIASVGMHVAGNALGTTLREAADRDLARLRHRTAVPAAVPRPKPTRLERRQSLGRLIPVSAGIGAMVVPYRRWPQATATFNGMLRQADRLKAARGHELGIIDALAEDYGALIGLAVKRVTELADRRRLDGLDDSLVGAILHLDPRPVVCGDNHFRGLLWCYWRRH
jgi:hypothetical protein